MKGSSLSSELTRLMKECGVEDELKRKNATLQAELDEMMMRLCERLRGLDIENEKMDENILELKEETMKLDGILNAKTENDHKVLPPPRSNTDSPKKRKAVPLESPVRHRTKINFIDV